MVAVIVLASLAALPTGVAGAKGPLRQWHQPKHVGSVHNDLSAPLSSMAPSARVHKSRVHRDAPMPMPTGTQGPDPVIQRVLLGSSAPPPAASFPGIGANGSAPSDSNAAVGPSFVVDLVNSELAVYTKTGAAVLGPIPTNTVWSGFGGECQSEDDGDGTVVYDALADRWVVSQFALGASGQGPFFQCVAVSATGDPTGSYYRYDFPFSSFPDYPKLAVWPDAYYQTMNTFSPSGVFTGAESCAYDRTSMLAGQPAVAQCFNTTTSYGALLPANYGGGTQPPTGAPDEQIGLGQDSSHLAAFAFHVDWSPGFPGTTLTETDVPVATYSAACGGGVCIPQLGTTQRLDSLADRMMYAFQYRNFGDHEAWVVTYSVDVNGAAAPRWFELRRTPPATSGALQDYQDSTFAPDSADRWMGSVAIDASGDIALGYSESSAVMHPAIEYTGRTPADPINTMEQETLLLQGAGSQTGGLNRWGDYSSMAVDPSDGCTFWYTNQYEPTTGSFNWATQLGSFAFPTCVPRADSDFSVALVPTTVSVAAGGTATTTVSTDWTAGATQSVSLTVSGLPSGASASLPASVTAAPGPPGTSSFTITTSASTPVGTYPITVTAAGPSTTHSATLTLTVGAPPPPPDFTVGVNPGSQTVAAGSSASYTVTVTPSSGFTGTVNLSASGMPSGTTASFSPPSITNGSGTSILTLSTMSSTPAGVSTVTVTATSGSLVHTTSIGLTVTVPQDFTLGVSPTGQTVAAGGSTSYGVTVSAVGGFSGIVSLSATGAPPGVSTSFTLTSVAGSGTSTLLVSTATTTAPGTYTLTVTGTSGLLTHSQPVSLIVTATPDFTITLSPSSQTIRRSGSASFTVTVTPTGGFSGTVTLSFSSKPSGASGSFSRSTLSSGTSTLTVSASKTGTYTVTVTAKSGATTHAASGTLTVTK
jgi:uncharacterized membrane protein